MPLATGTSINGATGSLALLDKDGAGVLKYLPVIQANASVTRNDSTPALVNNVPFPVNTIRGTALGSIGIDSYIHAGLHNAAFFNDLVASGAGDTGASGYSTITMRSNNQGGESAQVYGKCKAETLSGSVRFDRNGGASAMRIGVSYLSADPLSATVSAAAAPSAGALSTSSILSFVSDSFTGASNVVAVSFNIGTGLVVVPGNTTGSNAEYPILCAGLMQMTQGGTITITQIANPTTRLGSAGAAGTFTISAGVAGAGILMTFSVIPVSISKPVSVGIGMIESTYMLRSVDGVIAPFTVTDL